MKYMILSCLVLSACNSTENIRNNLIIQSKKYCECHGGISNLLMDNNTYSLTCNDGSSAKGSVDNIFVFGECKK